MDEQERDELTDLRDSVTKLQSWLTVILRTIDEDAVPLGSTRRAISEAREWMKRRFPDDETLNR